MELVATTTGAVAEAPSGPLFVLAEFIYDSTDPAAIYLKLQPIEDEGIAAPTTWVFARELLDTAIASNQAVGEGDIRITPVDDLDEVQVELFDSVNGDVWRFHFDLDAVIEFMLGVLHSVPAETPSMDVDDVIAKILGGAR